MPAYHSNDQCYVADSGVHGRGLFARHDIPAQSWIGHYDGAQTHDNDMHVLWVETETGEGLDGEDGWIGYDGTNELRFLNHASQPNGEMDGLNLYAARDIKAGEEITIHYGEEFESSVGET